MPLKFDTMVVGGNRRAERQHEERNQAQVTH